MEYRSSVFSLSVRLSALAILCASLAFVWAESKVNADGMTTCIQCDSNNVNGLSNCSSTLTSCNNNCAAAGYPAATGRRISSASFSASESQTLSEVW